MLDDVAAGLLLAAAVSAHNLEEIIWLPRFPHPPWIKVLPTPFAFRFAAVAVAALFWMVAIGLAIDFALESAILGFALAMVFNAAVPHLVLTLSQRRYHPGTATAWLLVMPAAICVISASSLSLSAILWALSLGVFVLLFLRLGSLVESLKALCPDDAREG